MSSRPQASTAASTTSGAVSPAVRSPAWTMASPPSAWATARAAAPSRSLTTTRAPAPLSLCTVYSPMPCPAPVTIATPPSSSPMVSLPSAPVEDGGASLDEALDALARITLAAACHDRGVLGGELLGPARVLGVAQQPLDVGIGGGRSRGEAAGLRLGRA